MPIIGKYNRISLTSEEILFVKKNFNKYTNKQFADHFGLKLTTTRTLIYKLGLKKMELEYWTDEQVNFLKENYKKIGDVELAEIFNSKWTKNKGWTKKHIEKKRRYLGLKRTEKQKLEIVKTNSRNGKYNTSEKSWKTRGVTKTGTLKVWKLSTGRSVVVIRLKDRFTPYAPYFYKNQIGEVPKGMNVCFKDGNPLNIVNENLVLKSDAELASENSKNRAPIELKETIRLINKINKKIKSKS